MWTISTPQSTKLNVFMIEPDNRLNLCNRPPEGWYCTRGAGHEGPCAAVRVSRKRAIISDAVDEIAGLYDGPPHGGYEKVEQVIRDAIEEAISNHQSQSG
jgi:hypothetical protein